VLAITVLIAGRETLLRLGGVFVFGFRTPSEFALIAVPCLALPIASLACWNSRIGAVLWSMMVAIVFGAEMIVDWPHVTVVYATGGFFSFVGGEILLVCAAVLDRHGAGTIAGDVK